MLHNLENQHQAQESNNQDGLLTQLQPGKERMNALLKIIETLETKPSPSFQDESDIINMRKEIVQITEDQKRIMEEFDKKYSTAPGATDAAAGVIDFDLNGFDNFAKRGSN